MKRYVQLIALLLTNCLKMSHSFRHQPTVLCNRPGKLKKISFRNKLAPKKVLKHAHNLFFLFYLKKSVFKSFENIYTLKFLQQMCFELIWHFFAIKSNWTFGFFLLLYQCTFDIFMLIYQNVW